MSKIVVSFFEQSENFPRVFFLKFDLNWKLLVVT